jgi:photosystem II stability/assembly factor-like uncharacterized protein
MTGNHELERQLRATLNDRAVEAPRGEDVADRVLAEVAGRPTATRSRRGWSTWTMPLLAAAAVVAVIAAVLGVSHGSDTAAPADPSMGATVSPANARTSATPESTLPTDFGPAPRAKLSPQPAPGIVQWDKTSSGLALNHFRAVDATFYGTDEVWLLGTADCLKGSVQPCPAMAQTDDGGKTWRSVPNPPGDPSQIRFANPRTGYAFSASRLDMTTNGTDWVEQPGGAVALETLDNNVIRVSRQNASCVGLCTDVVETAAVGSNAWTPSKLARVKARSVELQRTHGHAFLLLRDTAASKPGRPASALYSSDDGGAVWRARGDVCTKLGVGYSATSIAVGADGAALHVLCRNGHGRWAMFSGGRRATLPPGAEHYPLVELGAADAKTLFVVADRLYRSADGGQTWHAVLRYGPNSDLGAPEFESATVGRWFTDEGRVMWTTTDAGYTWHGVSFSS